MNLVFISKNVHDVGLLVVCQITATASNCDNSWLDVRAHLFKTRCQRLLSVNYSQMCLFSQEWKELNVSFIKIANFLTKY